VANIVKLGVQVEVQVSYITIKEYIVQHHFPRIL